MSKLALPSIGAVSCLGEHFAEFSLVFGEISCSMWSMLMCLMGVIERGIGFLGVGRVIGGFSTNFFVRMSFNSTRECVSVHK